MKAYHLRTKHRVHDRSLFSFTGSKSLIHDSIYIPERKVFVEFSKEEYKHKYGYIMRSDYEYEKAQQIVEGNNGAEGEIISEPELESDVVDRIVANSKGICRTVKTRVDYDGSTEDLVRILSGELIKKGLLSRIFSRN